MDLIPKSEQTLPKKLYMKGTLDILAFVYHKLLSVNANETV